MSKVVVRNMPGAGHIIGANFLYAAKPDGLVIGTFNTGLIYAQIIGRKGVRFDLAKMRFLGKASSDPRALVVSAKSGIATVAQLRAAAAPVRMSASGVGSAAYNETVMLADALGLNLKIIPGFSGREAEMAMLRGEVAGRLGSLSSLARFVRNGYGRVLLQVGGGGGAVQAATLATTDDGRALIALINSQASLGRLTAAPPGVPDDRMAALIAAYKGALGDPGLIREANRLGLPLDPRFGAEVDRMVRAALAQPPRLVAKIAALMNVEARTRTVTGALLSVGKKGKKIVFRGADGEKVKAKVSGSRTKITIAGKTAKRKALKAGMRCTIVYVPGGKNEPKTMRCE